MHINAPVEMPASPLIDSPVNLMEALHGMIDVKSLAVPFTLVVFLVTLSQSNFILFHTLTESFAIFIALLTTVLAWQLYAFNQNNFLMYLGCGYFWIAVLDSMHALTFKGMNIFTVTGTDIAVQFWISTRYLEAILLSTAPWFLSHSLKRNHMFVLCSVIALTLSMLVMRRHFPTAFIEGEGLTSFKVVSEYIIIGIIGTGIIYLTRQRLLIDQRVFILLIASMAFSIIAELAFTYYVNIYSLSNMVGHIFKLISYWLIFIAVVRTTLREPFSTLSRAVTHYDAVPDATLLIDNHGFIQHVNKAACTLTDKTTIELVGKHSHDVFHNIKVNKDDCPVCQSIKIKDELSAYELKTDESSWRDFSTSCLQNEDKFIEVIRDITDRKTTENNLLLAQCDVIRSQEIAHLGSWRLDHTTNQIIFSDELHRIFGSKQGEFGTTYEEFIDSIHPHDQAYVMESFQSSIDESKDIYETNHRIIRKKTGEIRFVHERCTHEKDHKGKVIRSLGIMHDITDTTRAQKKILKKEHEQREIIDAMADASITIDETGNIVSFNKKAEELYGYSYSEIIGKNSNILIPEPYAQEHYDDLQRYIETGESHLLANCIEVEGLHKNKQSFPIRLSVAELPSDDTGIRRFLYTCHDLTILKQQEEQLHRAQKMDALGKLTGGIAHDYNNMLGVVMGYANLLERMLKDQPKMAKYANQIQHAGERGAKLTKKLLSFSRQTSSEDTKVQINNMLQKEKDMLQKTLTASIKLSVRTTVDVWPVWLDSSDLEDAILNICINAKHAMNDTKSESRLSISTCNQSLNSLEALALNLKEGDYVQLIIADTGSGMDDVTKEKIFDPFFSTKGEKGTGLGLAQVFSFVKRAKGTIAVNSSLNRGTEFVLYFPRYLDDVSEKLNDANEDVIDLCGNENILVVDDEPALRELASELLKQQGYQVICAESGKHALHVLAHEHVDMVLCDIIMPEMNGNQLASVVREKHPDIKILLTSGFADEYHIDMIDEILHQNLLHKPYPPRDLFNKVRNLLDNKVIPISKTTQMADMYIRTKLEWTDSLSVGVDELDKDHKSILSLLNSCIVIASVGNQNKRLEAIFKELFAYVDYHLNAKRK